LDEWELENFQKMSKNIYTFNNGRFETFFTISWIDKFTIFTKLDTKGGRIEIVASI
jgi:hypothetical protein